jgi:hypothetical protein
MNKNRYILYLSIFVVSVLVYFTTKRVKKMETIQEALQRINKGFGKEIAVNVEKIARLESGHFFEGNSIFKHTKGYGMVATSPTYPYGWNSMVNYWHNSDELAPTGLYESRNGLTYICFNNYFAGLFPIAVKMKLSDNNPGAWYSNDIDKQTEYNDKIDKLKAKYV